MNIYPKSYHAACNHLINVGVWHARAKGRALVARALRDLRARFGRDRCRRERYHLAQINGMFPDKPGTPKPGE